MLGKDLIYLFVVLPSIYGELNTITFIVQNWPKNIIAESVVIVVIKFAI